MVEWFVRIKEMDDLLTVIISVTGGAITSFLVAKYYGER